jgi:hypothetical protein
MGSLSAKNASEKFSRLGTFKQKQQQKLKRVRGNLKKDDEKKERRKWEEQFTVVE